MTHDAKIKVVHGGNEPNNENQPGDEAMLDLETTTVVYYPLEKTFMENGDLEEPLQYALDQGTKLGASSVSYGRDRDQHVRIGNAARLSSCTEMGRTRNYHSYRFV